MSDTAQKQVVQGFKIELVNSQDNGKGGIEWRVDVTDPALLACDAAFDVGDDFTCIYGATADEAIRNAIEFVENGTAETFFAKVRTYHGVTPPKRRRWWRRGT